MELARSQSIDEAGARRVDVEHAEGSATTAEAVLDVGRDRDERAGTGAVPFAVPEELDLAFKHVERIGVVGVGVRVDALELRPERELEHLEMRQLCEDAVAVRCPLSFARSREVRLL